jgi:antitoxin (DNA-binding transcriptional repressor) of toxin-antitoxin stability system
MTTLSPTQARVNLSSLLKRAAKGEDIGILHGDQVIALRPVTVHADDYAIREYGVTEKELDRFVKRADRQIIRERKAGKIKKYSGNLEADLAD